MRLRHAICARASACAHTVALGTHRACVVTPAPAHTIAHTQARTPTRAHAHRDVISTHAHTAAHIHAPRHARAQARRRCSTRMRARAQDSRARARGCAPSLYLKSESGHDSQRVHTYPRWSRRGRRGPRPREPPPARRPCRRPRHSFAVGLPLHLPPWGEWVNRGGGGGGELMLLLCCIPPSPPDLSSLAGPTPQRRRWRAGPLCRPAGGVRLRCSR